MSIKAIRTIDQDWCLYLPYNIFHKTANHYAVYRGTSEFKTYLLLYLNNTIVRLYNADDE